jgi:hypothetical protein
MCKSADNKHEVFASIVGNYFNFFVFETEISIGDVINVSEI